MEQLALVGAATPPNLHLTRRQRFALEFIHHRPVSSEELGAALHQYRKGEGGKGHDATERCDFCQVEGAGMGARLREFGLVRYARNLEVWYCVEDGRPGAEPARQPEGTYDPASQEIPF
jgi:hypothetical protein